MNLRCAHNLGYFNRLRNARLARLGWRWQAATTQRSGYTVHVYPRGEDTRDWSDAEVAAYEAGWRNADRTL